MRRGEEYLLKANLIYDLARKSNKKEIDVRISSGKKVGKNQSKGQGAYALRGIAKIGGRSGLGFMAHIMKGEKKYYSEETSLGESLPEVRRGLAVKC